MDSVNKNVMLEYIMMNSVFETLMQVSLILCYVLCIILLYG